MASPAELSAFLASVERRAFKQAVYAVRDEDAALDIVQDSMIKLSERYGDKPAAELPLLFQRILQNTVNDFFRRQKVRSTWTTLFSNMQGSGDDDDYDFLEALGSTNRARPPLKVRSTRSSACRRLGVIEAEIQRLPARQREAFVMRYWEDMDVAETAAANGLLGRERQDALLQGYPHLGGGAQGKRESSYEELHI